MSNQHKPFGDDAHVAPYGNDYLKCFLRIWSAETGWRPGCLFTEGVRDLWLVASHWRVMVEEIKRGGATIGALYGFVVLGL